MIAAVCQHERARTNGTTKAGAARFRCKDCGKTWTESTKVLGGMRIGIDRAAKIVQLLCEGMTVRAIARVTGCDTHTILDLLVMVGERCEAYMAEHIRGIQVDDIQCDEIWQYVYCKLATARRKNMDESECGDSWCWTAIDRTSKLLVTWHFGGRRKTDADVFVAKLDVATAGRFHLSTDSYGPYENSVSRRANLARRVDYGQITKVYGEASKEERRRYSPARIIGCSKKVVLGEPEFEKTCTSHCERMNGSIRHFTKRMGRLTYAFSKKWDNHRAAMGLFFMHYNWCRKHRSLKGETPAMAHGLATRRWTERDLIVAVGLHT